jgi:hypothetical protein
VHYINILWKPESISEQQAVELASRALGIAMEEKISVVVSVSQQ